MLEIVIQEVLCRYGDLIQQYEVSLSRMLNGILTLDQQWLPNQSDFPPISWPWYRPWPSPNHEWCPWSICNGCGMPAGNAYPSGHLVPSSHFGTYLCSNCWDQIHRTCHVFTRLFTSNTPGYFLDFACSISESEITFLDTTIYNGERFMESRILDIKSYIKTTDEVVTVGLFCLKPKCLKGMA